MRKCLSDRRCGWRLAVADEKVSFRPTLWVEIDGSGI